MPELVLSKRGRVRARLWRFWILVYLGNAAGALAVGALVAAGDVLGAEEVERLREIIGEKMRFQGMGADGWFRAVASGILGNWLVGMAAFNAAAARTVSGKILGIVFPIVTFVALGVQHSPANMGYFAVGLIEGDMGTSWAKRSRGTSCPRRSATSSAAPSSSPCCSGTRTGASRARATLFVTPTARRRRGSRPHPAPRSVLLDHAKVPRGLRLAVAVSRSKEASDARQAPEGHETGRGDGERGPSARAAGGSPHRS